MKGERISIVITETCQKLGIDYHSINKKIMQLYYDAKELGQIYLDLRIIIGKLQEIEEHHNLNGIGNLLQDDVKTLENIDHDINKIAKKMREMEDE